MVADVQAVFTEFGADRQRLYALEPGADSHQRTSGPRFASQGRLRLATNKAVLEPFLDFSNALQVLVRVIVTFGHDLSAGVAYFFDDGIPVHLRSP